MASTVTTIEPGHRMKLKMAPNSLFAVLLRSPWWISLGIAAGFIGVAQALLPPEYRGPFSLGAFPFLVIGGIALWRQLRAPSPAQAQAILDGVRRMPWAAFRRALQQGYERQGYTVECIDGAADLLLRREGSTMLVSAKRWKAAHHGEETVAALRAAARQRDASGCIYVALGELSPQARRLAQAQQVELLDGAALVTLLRGLVPSA